MRQTEGSRLQELKGRPRSPRPHPCLFSALACACRSPKLVREVPTPRGAVALGLRCLEAGFSGGRAGHTRACQGEGAWGPWVTRSKPGTGQGAAPALGLAQPGAPRVLPSSAGSFLPGAQGLPGEPTAPHSPLLPRVPALPAGGAPAPGPGEASAQPREAPAGAEFIAEKLFRTDVHSETGLQSCIRAPRSHTPGPAGGGVPGGSHVAVGAWAAWALGCVGQ